MRRNIGSKTRMAPRSHMVSAAILAVTGFSLAFSYTNCSPVNFDTSNEKMSSLLTDDAFLLINQDAMYTNDSSVRLTLNNRMANEVYVTNAPDCASGGEWRKYEPELPWVLGQANAETKVYAKFRNTENPEAKSECVSDSIIHDNMPPAVFVSQPAPRFTNQKGVEVGFSASDALSGVEKVICSDVETGAVLPCSDKVRSEQNKEGSHSVSIVAIDRAGNRSLPSTESWLLDLTPPVVAFNSAPAAVTGSSSASFDFTGTDAGSGVKGYECKVDNAPSFAACVSPQNVNLAEGIHTYYVRAIDKAGNVSNPIEHRWKIDLTAPIVRIDSHPGPFVNTRTGDFTFSGTDDGQPITRFECRIDSGAFQSCTSPYKTPTLDEGKHTFEVRGYDTAGIPSSPVSYSWVIDVTGPKITLTKTPAKVTNDPKAPFLFTIVEAGSGLKKSECQLDGGAFVSCDSSYVPQGLMEGSHSFVVRAEDMAGNVASTSPYTWKLDITPPTIEIVSGPDAFTRRFDAEFTLRATDANGGAISQVLCKLDGAADFAACESMTSHTVRDLLEGRHTLIVRAVDQAGNSSSVDAPKARHDWMVDAGGPMISYSIVPPSVNSALDSVRLKFTVTDSLSGVQQVSCTLDGAQDPCSESTDRTFQNLALGEHTYVVNAIDKAGNSSTDTKKFTVADLEVQKSLAIQVKENKKADILIVIDNSGSMAPEQANMASRFATFIDNLAGLDWQLAIVTTDVSADANLKDGRFLEMSGMAGTYILKSSMDPAKVREAFGKTIQRPANEGSSEEQGIKASYRAIERSSASGNVNIPNAAFFRADSALSIIVVSDDAEGGTMTLGTKNMPESLISLVNSKFPGKPFAFHSIVVPTEFTVSNRNYYKGSADPCYNKREDVTRDGSLYMQLSRLTGGIIGTACADDYGSQLTAIGKGTVELVNSATLECVPTDRNRDGKANDVTVTLSGGGDAGPYRIDGQKISFERSLPPGQVNLSYYCLK